MYEQDNGADKLNSSGNKIVSSDYLEWAKKIESYESGIPQIEENALNVYEAVKNYFAAIDLNTNTLDSSIYAEGSASITFDFVNYFNGSIQITDEKWASQKNLEFYVDSNGNLVSKDVYYQYECTYADGSEFSGTKTVEVKVEDINGDGVIDENDRTIYERVQLDGEFTAPDGSVYKMTSDRVFDGGIVKCEATFKADDGTVVEVNSEYVDENNDGVPDEGTSVKEATIATNISEDKEQEFADAATEGTGANITVDHDGEYSSEVNESKPELDVVMTDVESTSDINVTAVDDYGTNARNTSVADSDGNTVYTQVHSSTYGEMEGCTWSVEADGVSGQLVLNTGNEVGIVTVEPDPNNPGQYIQTSYIRGLKYDGTIDESIPPSGKEVKVISGDIVTKTLTSASGESLTLTYCNDSEIGSYQVFKFVETEINGGEYKYTVWDDGRKVMDSKNGDTITIDGETWSVSVTQ